MSGPGEPAATPAVDAARSYRDVIGKLDAAVGAVRDHDRRQEAVLRRRLAELAEASAAAERRAALARLGVELAWDRVVDQLWHETWMTLRPHPRPAPEVDAAALDDLVSAAERAAAEVLDATRRRAFGFGGR